MRWRSHRQGARHDAVSYCDFRRLAESYFGFRCCKRPLASRKQKLLVDSHGRERGQLPAEMFETRGVDGRMHKAWTNRHHCGGRGHSHHRRCPAPERQFRFQSRPAEPPLIRRPEASLPPSSFSSSCPPCAHLQGKPHAKPNSLKISGRRDACSWTAVDLRRHAGCVPPKRTAARPYVRQSSGAAYACATCELREHPAELAPTNSACRVRGRAPSPE
jgi:hypothetical protein